MERVQPAPNYLIRTMKTLVLPQILYDDARCIVAVLGL